MFASRARERIGQGFAIGLALAVAVSCGGGGDSPAPNRGEVDLSFADGGVFTIDASLVPGNLQSSSSADFVTTDAAGNVWATGGFDMGITASSGVAKIPFPLTRTHAIVVSLLPDGRKNEAFGTSGYFVDSPREFHSQKGVVAAPLADGGTVVAELASGWDTFFPQLVPSGRAIRLGARGVVDGNYGDAGAVVASLERFMQAVVDPAGGVVFLGERRRATAQQSYGYMELRRFDAQGREDTGFLLRSRDSLDCSLPTPYQSVAWARAAPQADGKLLVAQVITGAPGGLQRLCVSRLDPDGALDATYGSGGKVQVEEWGDAAIASISGLFVSGDGGATIVITLRRQGTLPLSGYAVLSLTPQGAVDRTRYGGGGVGHWDHAVGWVLASAVQDDGKILVAGPTPLFDGGYRLERIGTDGKADSEFGPGGQGYRSLDISGWRLEPKHLHVARGAIFVSGVASPLDGGVDAAGLPRFAIVKLAGDRGR